MGGTSGNEPEGGVQEARGAMSQKGTYRVPLETREAREKEMVSGRQKFFADDFKANTVVGIANYI